MLSRIKIAEVIDRCASEFNLSYRSLLERNRVKHVIQARKLTYACLRFAGVSLPYMAVVMERDHTSISHALDTIDKDMKVQALNILFEMGIEFRYGKNLSFKNLKRGVAQKYPPVIKPKVYKKIPDYRNNIILTVEV